MRWTGCSDASRRRTRRGGSPGRDRPRHSGRDERRYRSSGAGCWVAGARYWRREMRDNHPARPTRMVWASVGWREVGDTACRPLEQGAIGDGAASVRGGAEGAERGNVAASRGCGPAWCTGGRDNQHIRGAGRGDGGSVRDEPAGERLPPEQRLLHRPVPDQAERQGALHLPEGRKALQFEQELLLRGGRADDLQVGDVPVDLSGLLAAVGCRLSAAGSAGADGRSMNGGGGCRGDGGMRRERGRSAALPSLFPLWPGSPSGPGRCPPRAPVVDG
jgi:hypothetical protein